MRGINSQHKPFFTFRPITKNMTEASPPKARLEITTLHGKKVLWEDVDADSTTIEDLYRRVGTIETTPDGKWKLMMVKPYFKTLKWSDKECALASVGIQPPASDGNNSLCRIEVVLDMGACHTTCKRTDG